MRGLRQPHRRSVCAIRACTILTSRSIIARAPSTARTRIARAASTARTRGSRWDWRRQYEISGGKIQPYALTDGRPTAEQPQDAPIGRLAFPGLAKRARRGATRAPPGIKAYLV